jgi:hypothetical protein
MEHFRALLSLKLFPTDLVSIIQDYSYAYEVTLVTMPFSKGDFIRIELLNCFSFTCLVEKSVEPLRRCRHKSVPVSWIENKIFFGSLPRTPYIDKEKNTLVSEEVNLTLPQYAIEQIENLVTAIRWNTK